MTPLHQPPRPGTDLHALLAAMIGDDAATFACALILIALGLCWLPLAEWARGQAARLRARGGLDKDGGWDRA